MRVFLARGLCPLFCCVALAAITQPLTAAEIEQHLFPPELVMSHQARLGLAEEQRQGLVQEVQALQSEVVPWQLELGQVGETLAELVAMERVDEQAAVAAAGRITALEAKIKKRHLAALIRIKNLLSAEQQGTLHELRSN